MDPFNDLLRLQNRLVELVQSWHLKTEEIAARILSDHSRVRREVTTGRATELVLRAYRRDMPAQPSRPGDLLDIERLGHALTAATRPIDDTFDLITSFTRITYASPVLEALYAGISGKRLVGCPPHTILANPTVINSRVFDNFLGSHDRQTWEFDTSIGNRHLKVHSTALAGYVPMSVIANGLADLMRCLRRARGISNPDNSRYFHTINPLDDGDSLLCIPIVWGVKIEEVAATRIARSTIPGDVRPHS